MTLDPPPTDVELIARLDAVPGILAAVAETTGMRFVAVARVTDATWTACAVHDQIAFGLVPGGQLPLETTICDEIREHRAPVVFGQASEHPLFATHTTPKMYGFESYISVPIFRGDGEFFGTLCAIDPEPAKLDASTVRLLEIFTRLIAAQMDAEERVQAGVTALARAEDAGRLRDQLIAVVGHDLRNPLQAISMGTELLGRAPLEPRWQAQIGRMRRSCERMTELIDNVLDFARGQLGGGIPVALREESDLTVRLQHVIAEVQAANTSHRILVRLLIDRPVVCDHRRIGQLLSNLLANAVAHGDADQPVEVDARVDGEHFELSVANGGPAIPLATRDKLFKPFSRLSGDTTRSGLGLGLYIAAEIASAHRGTIALHSPPGAGTCFVFRMPLR